MRGSLGEAFLGQGAPGLAFARIQLVGTEETLGVGRYLAPA